MDQKDKALVADLINLLDKVPEKRQCFILGNILGMFKHKYDIGGLDNVLHTLETEFEDLNLCTRLVKAYHILEDL